MTGWWFWIFFYFHPETLGKMDPIWRLHIFQMGWFNHQLDDISCYFFPTRSQWVWIPWESAQFGPSSVDDPSTEPVLVRPIKKQWGMAYYIQYILRFTLYIHVIKRIYNDRCCKTMVYTDTHTSLYIFFDGSKVLVPSHPSLQFLEGTGSRAFTLRAWKIQ